jgi:hypothetical protein
MLETMPGKPDKVDLEQLLSSYLDGTCSEKERRQVELGLQRDPHLRTLQEELTRTIDAVRATPSEASPSHVRERILSQLERRALIGMAGTGRQRDDLLAAPRSNLAHWSRLGLLAAAMLVLGIGATWWYRTRVPQTAYQVAMAPIPPLQNTVAKVSPPSAALPQRDNDARRSAGLNPAAPPKSVAPSPETLTREDAKLPAPSERTVVSLGQSPAALAGKAKDNLPPTDQLAPSARSALRQDMGPAAGFDLHVTKEMAGAPVSAPAASVAANRSSPHAESVAAASRDYNFDTSGSAASPETTIAPVLQLDVDVRDVGRQVSLTEQIIADRVTGRGGHILSKEDGTTLAVGEPGGTQTPLAEVIRGVPGVLHVQPQILPASDPAAHQALSLAAGLWIRASWHFLEPWVEPADPIGYRMDGLAYYFSASPVPPVTYTPTVIVLHPVAVPQTQPGGDD